MQSKQPLQTIPDDELLRRLDALVHDSRRTEADLVAHIAEVDNRHLYVREAAPSMFQYCTERLHLSGAEAYLLIAAARVSREHPTVLTMLADGRLHLTAIALLAPHLTAANRDVLLLRATHKTKREVEEIVAELAPRPDARAVIRKIPERRQGKAGAFIALWSIGSSPAPPTNRQPALPAPLPSVLPSSPAPALVPSLLALSIPDPVADLGPELRPDGVASGSDAPALSSRREAMPDPTPLALERPSDHGAEPLEIRTTGRMPRSASIEPLSPARYRVQFTASAGLREKLERLRDLMRSSVPDGDLAAIIETVVTEKLERLESRRFARTEAPRRALPQTGNSRSSRHVPAAVRRAVHARDEGQCRYVDGNGRRCSARALLEFHHRRPFALGGEHSMANVSLLCRAHNHSWPRSITAAKPWPRSGARTQEPGLILSEKENHPFTPRGRGEVSYERAW